MVETALRAARVAQGGVRPSRGRPSRAARRGRSCPASRLADGGAGDAARDVDEEAATRPRGGRARASPDRRARTGSISPPWAPIARDEERQARGHRPDRRAAPSGAVAPTTRPTVPPGPQPRRAPGDAQVERLGRAHRSTGPRRRPGPGARRRPGWTSGTGRRRTGRRVRGAARSPRRPRYGLTVTASAPRTVEQRDRLAGGRRADVAALRVDDDRDVGRDRGPDPLERGHARPSRTPRRTRGSA